MWLSGKGRPEGITDKTGLGVGARKQFPSQRIRRMVPENKPVTKINVNRSFF